MNLCSDGRIGILNGLMIFKFVDFWVCFYCEFDFIFFINLKLSVDFLIYVFLIMLFFVVIFRFFV